MRRARTLRVLSYGSARRGQVALGALVFPCALGRGGIVARKREGDGGTPRGVWRISEAWFRPDRLRRPRTGLPSRALRPADGWCDDIPDRNYNRGVRLPYTARSEEMWRPDGLYDAGAVIDYNRRPRVRGLGSAIFLHVARPGFEPTEGCVALKLPHLLRLLARLGRGARIRIG